MTGFRIGATSFVYPDGWLANVERLAGRVEDVEILLFEPAPPGREELAGLVDCKARAGLTYTLHTPLAVSLASQDERRRRESVRVVRQVIADTRPLAPEACVVHVYLGEREGDPPPRDLAGWRRRARGSLEAIAADVPPAALCVESLDYDFALIAPVVEELGLSIALDLGHHRRDGRPELEALGRYLHRTRVIQWHGVDPSGRDHRSLAHLPRDRARAVVDRLRAGSYGGVLTLEVFRPDDFEESLALVRGLVAEGGR